MIYRLSVVGTGMSDTSSKGLTGTIAGVVSASPGWCAVAAAEKGAEFAVLLLDGETDLTAFVSIAGVFGRVVGDDDEMSW